MSEKEIMSIELSEAIPLGRTFKEYTEMFGMGSDFTGKRILDCGGGPSSFNAEQFENSVNIISIDPLYKYTRDKIKRRIDETFEDIIDQTRQNQDKFSWSTFKSVEDIAENRRKAMDRFLSDYDAGLRDSRYLAEELPKVSFEDNKFDLALSSHLLFLYEKLFSFEFHVNAIIEMLRVAKEVRIFPLVDLNAEKCSYIDEIMDLFSNKNLNVSIVSVAYESQKGGNQYMKIKK